MTIADSQGPRMNRRQVIGLGAAGLGALGFGAIASGPAVAAGPKGTDPFAHLRASTGFSTLAASPPTPGLSYVAVGSFDFFPSGVGVDRIIDNGVRPSVLSQLVARVPIPVGAVVKELTVWAENTSMTPFDVDFGTIPVGGGVMIGGAVDFAKVTVPPGAVVTSGQSTSLSGTVTLDDIVLVGATMTVLKTQQIWSARIGYVPPPTFVAITPQRVYDSRVSAYPNSGLLAPNSNRVISVKDGRNNAGVLTTTDAVPVGATAVSFNLTVTGSTGVNFLSVGPGDTPGVSTSTINFPGGDDRANGGVVKLSSNREIKVFNGDRTGSTHFIVDITGYTF